MSSLIFLFVLVPSVVNTNSIGINCNISSMLPVTQCVEVKPKSMIACMAPIKGECEYYGHCFIFKSSYEFPC